MGVAPEGQELPFPAIWSRSKSHTADIPQPPAVRHFNDEEVMCRLKAGDSNALNPLLDRYSRLVLDIAHHVLQDFGEAEEIVQDVFFQVYQKAHLFDPSRGKAK